MVMVMVVLGMVPLVAVVLLVVKDIILTLLVSLLVVAVLLVFPLAMDLLAVVVAAVALQMVVVLSLLAEALHPMVTLATHTCFPQPPVPYYPAPPSKVNMSPPRPSPNGVAPKRLGVRLSPSTPSCWNLTNTYGNIGHHGLITTLQNLKDSKRLCLKLLQSLPDVTLDHFFDNLTYYNRGTEMLHWLMEANKTA
jgi:hypothetical protein